MFTLPPVKMVPGMASPAFTSPLRQMLEGQLSQLSDEVERLFDEARGRARRELADQLNQAVRRIRQTASLDELAATLLDAAGAFSTGAAVFRISNEAAKGEVIRGVSEEAAREFSSLVIPFASAAALAGAVQSRDPIVAVTTTSEVSSELAALAAHPPDGRASIYPLVTRDHVPALLYAWGTVQGPALELLTQMAAAVWNSLAAPAPSELVTIAPAQPDATPSPANTWDSLSPEEQAIHLRAQRFARVQVAEMRLHEPAAVLSGRALRNLYEALRPRIDAARETMRESFFVPCPSMVDYLHVELVRTLAHDDPELLGKDYPGPLV